MRFSTVRAEHYPATGKVAATHARTRAQAGGASPGRFGARTGRTGRIIITGKGRLKGRPESSSERGRPDQNCSRLTWIWRARPFLFLGLSELFGLPPDRSLGILDDQAADCPRAAPAPEQDAA
jgi:hypothetical protein